DRTYAEPYKAQLERVARLLRRQDLARVRAVGPLQLTRVPEKCAPGLRERIARLLALSVRDRLRDEQARARIGLHVLRVNGHRADEHEGLPLLVQGVRHHGREGVTRVLARERGERSGAHQIRERPGALGVRRFGNRWRTAAAGRPGVAAHA